MRAALYDHTGPAREVLRVMEMGQPEPGPGEPAVDAAPVAVSPR